MEHINQYTLLLHYLCDVIILTDVRQSYCVFWETVMSSQLVSSASYGGEAVSYVVEWETYLWKAQLETFLSLVIMAKVQKTRREPVVLPQFPPLLEKHSAHTHSHARNPLKTPKICQFEGTFCEMFSSLVVFSPLH